MNKYLISKDKFNEFYDLYLYSFNRDDSQHRKDVFKERFDHSLVYGIMNGQKLGSGLFSIPFDINFHGVGFKMNGIGDVMSAPEFGGRGGASSLMKAALTDMYQNNVTLSYLAPFSFGYYRQFGYEQVFDHTKITMENTQLPRVKNSDQGHVERFAIKDLPEAVKTMYFENNHRGGVVRATWWWDHMLDKHQDYQIALAYDDNDVLIGYLIYYDENETFNIHEWFNLNPLSRKLLLKFVTKHQSIFQRFSYESPDPDFKADLLIDPYSAKLEVTPYMMARIVNLEDFLKRYPIKKMNLAKIYFKVDDTLEWNNHTWELSINDGIVDLKIADDKKDDFEVSIQSLTKAMFGYRSLNSLAKYGFIQGDLGKIKALDEVFVHEKPQLIDYF
ncbi:GNAT family N-acetyltransferase [Companilactobacillus kimchiensis]|uniref:Acetyltransferase n=1 Tax=Companilactobacillus kimchiensis TaxID=993692 RepID=A0A0R2LE10_9LACO|nr:GNAT family N-acetyltransferase [Companilactobacillus kimchiensis]KRO00168.1 acetyltransferase [Companilactobacillus kimchiensis]